MGTLQEQARALGDPTRHEVFSYLADAGRPVDVAELTAHVGLHHNAVRQHLAKLLDAGLVTEATARRDGPGRPRLVYEIAPSTESRWGVVGPYERLSLWLAELVATGDAPVEVGRRAGRALALAASDPHDPSAPSDPSGVLIEEMARTGFEPSVSRKGTRLDIVLHACPFASTAAAAPETVCQLHLGMAQGIAEASDGIVVDELVTKDPHRARCRLRCHLDTDGKG